MSTYTRSGRIIYRDGARRVRVATFATATAAAIACRKLNNPNGGRRGDWRAVCAA